MAPNNHMVHKFINIVIAPIFFLIQCFLLPPYLVFKLVAMITSHFFSESVKDKVVLITGASSGIGEQLAYEYAKRGACLVIVARREKELKEVAERAMRMGSPDVLPIPANVSNVKDCERFVNEAINHFGRLDHLVNNAGITCYCAIEDVTDITKFEAVMDINFWGSVYPVYFAIPHLKKTKGKIVINSSSAALFNPPRLSFYAASKAALISFYDALRVELASSVTITIVTLGYIDSEITQGKYLSKAGLIEINPKLIEDIIQGMPLMSSDTCAKAIVNGVCRGERYITEPKWYQVLVMLKELYPEFFDWYYRNFT